MAACPYIVPLEWDASVDVVCRGWLGFAQIYDSNFIQLHHCTNVHQYIVLKCCRIVSTVSEVGQAGWAFYDHDLSWYVPCLVWADGKKGSQTTPYVQPEPWEHWWPCICLNITPNAAGLLPFYCPALAWQNARPWWVHVSRVRRLVRGVNGADTTTQQACPSQAPPQAAQAPPRRDPQDRKHPFDNRCDCVAKAPEER